MNKQNLELKQAIQTQQDSITRLETARVKDSKAIDEIRDSQIKTAQSTASVLNKLNKLGSASDEIKKFLSQPVPGELGRVLNDARSRRTGADTIKGSFENLSRP